MRMTYAVHIVTGTLGLLSGFVALYVAKGGSTHRKSGMLFVYTMIMMSLFGMSISLARGVASEINVPAGLLTSYLIITALISIRPPAAAQRSLHIAVLLVAAGVGVTMLTFGIEALANGGKRNGMPAFPFFMFGIVGTLGAAGDLRVIRSGARRGGSRLARHLWRMSFALFIATLSFTVQIAKMIPKQVHIPGPLFALPMLAVLFTMLYWLWRVRSRRPRRGIVGVNAAQPA